MSSIKIKDIPKEERPLEKLLRNGADKLNNKELLAVILGSGTREESVIGLADRIIARFEGIDKVLVADIRMLKEIKGVGEVKAARIAAVSELSSRYKYEREKRKADRITDPETVYKIYGHKMEKYEKEVVMVVALNTKKEIISEEEISIGINNSSLIHPREVFNYAIRKSADSIILIHNHPSGDVKPSKNDINVTTRLKECGKLVGIELVDHIIIGKSKHYSFKEKGLV